MTSEVGSSLRSCLELLDLLMATELLGKAETVADKERDGGSHSKP